MAHPVDPTPCRGYVALTFDDGPSERTGRLLEVLRAADAPATFFNVGRRVAENPGLVTQQVSAGHQVANHSYSHVRLTTLSPGLLRRELSRATAVLRPIGPVRYFRPPFGDYDEIVAAEAERQGLRLTLWTADSQDYRLTSLAQIVTRASAAQPGGIVLFHDGPELTVAAVPRVVDAYRARGLCMGLLGPSPRPHHPAGSPGRQFFVQAVAAPVPR